MPFGTPQSVEISNTLRQMAPSDAVLALVYLAYSKGRESFSADHLRTGLEDTTRHHLEILELGGLSPVLGSLDGRLAGADGWVHLHSTTCAYIATNLGRFLPALEPLAQEVKTYARPVCDPPYRVESRGKAPI